MEPYQMLEREFAKWVGVESVVGCSSGTAALHLALEGLGLPLKSKVIIPDFTMVACARAVTLTGLTPVFVDCRRSDLLIDLDLVDEACSKEGGNIRAIMPVHVYGRQCDMDGVIDLATKYDLCVVEDLAEAHLSKPHPGSDAACWSFYRNKIIAGEEGGAVWFRNSGADDLGRKLRSLGFTENHDYHHVPRGHNYRLSNLHATAILDSLRAVENRVAYRRHLEDAYQTHCPPNWRMPARSTPWVYDLRLKGLCPKPDEKESIQDRIIKTLRAEGVQARHSFKPMSLQWEYFGEKDVKTYRRGHQALIASREVIYLPLQPGTVPATSTADQFAERAFDTIQRVLVAVAG